jgi:4-hydroxyproline epimerase
MTTFAAPIEIDVVDSHTEGEPTRIVIAGGPDLGSGEMRARREVFRERFDHIRSAVVCEPRGSDVWVGGLLCESPAANCVAGVIFFTTAGFLGMCGHGTIGFMATLHYLGRIQPGRHRIATPVGIVTATLHDATRVSVENVPSYRLRKDVELDVPDYGPVVGDVAWGGNWFFLVKETAERIALNNVDRLIHVTKQIEQALWRGQVTGAAGERIDHVELYGDGTACGADSQSFVLCPGGSYDRSPCGTGTSAKLACLAEDGRLRPGEPWRQAGILGSVFECSYRRGEGGSIVPTISGRAFISGRGKLILHAADPFRFGVRG